MHRGRFGSWPYEWSRFRTRPVECLPHLPNRADKQHEGQPADHLRRQRCGDLFVRIHVCLDAAVSVRQDTNARLASWLITTGGVPIRTSSRVARPPNGASAAMNNVICAMPM